MKISKMSNAFLNFNLCKKNMNFLYNLNKHIANKSFSQKESKKTEKVESEVLIRKNNKNEDEIDIVVPSDYQPYYSFGNLGKLPLFNNVKDLNNFTVFIPNHKTNILIFSIYTYLSYGSVLFQPSLLLTCYLLNKYFLNNCRKELEILFIALNADRTTLLVKTFDRDLNLEISDTKISEKPSKIGSKVYYELTNSQLKHPLYFNVTDGQVLSKELFKSVLTGEVSKVNLIYS